MESHVNIEAGKGAEVHVSASDYAAQDELDMQRLGKKQQLKVGSNRR